VFQQKVGKDMLQKIQTLVKQHELAEKVEGCDTCEALAKAVDNLRDERNNYVSPTGVVTGVHPNTWPDLDRMAARSAMYISHTQFAESYPLAAIIVLSYDKLKKLAGK